MRPQSERALGGKAATEERACGRGNTEGEVQAQQTPRSFFKAY